MKYKRSKTFTEEQLQELFRSVEWFSGHFPQQLQKAFRNSTRVISAWKGTELSGLIRGLDDGGWQAIIDCLLVRPEYQGIGVGAKLLQMLLADYENFLYVNVVPDEKRMLPFIKNMGLKSWSKELQCKERAIGQLCKGWAENKYVIYTA